MSDRILITDIGSTTTKAILLVRDGGEHRMYGPVHAPTTVEKPFEDVMQGVIDSLDGLQRATDQKLLAESGTEIDRSNLYLTTSSAGGGLQILVVGLTVFDSASSARRASYGAGGVLLDVFAIDDKRSAIEQMIAMQRLFPDIILFSGGIDGGAVSGLIRLGELLSMADPKAKFGSGEKVPLVYAGNKDAQNVMEVIFRKGFDLHVVPNLRPTMQDENLGPACDKIHQLFMDHVMERAPGYSALKTIVGDDIIPTPTGVMKSMQILSETLACNVMAVDIGGATTDIFSSIEDNFYRTVSANYGMSYSIANVMKDATREKLLERLPDTLTDCYVTNYIGNKMLFPTTCPDSEAQFTIERITASLAIDMSKKQHLEMHFNAEQIGFLDRFKNREFDKFTETVYYNQKMNERRFHPRDIGIMIGAGGVLAAAPTPMDALMMIVDGLTPQGITEIWRDRHFTMPHLGKLSDIDEELAKTMLLNECFEKLAMVVTPLARKVKPGKTVMKIEIVETGKRDSFTMSAGQIRFVDNPERKKRSVIIELEKNIFLQDNEHSASFETDLPILFDARFGRIMADDQDASDLKPIEEHFRHDDQEGRIVEGENELTIELPYPGEIKVKKGDLVRSETLVGEILYDPPRIYIVNLFDVKELSLDSKTLEKFILVKVGDKVEMGQNLIDKDDVTFMDELRGKTRTYQSPVRGMVERINYDDGTIIMREIQDYSNRPHKIDVAHKLGVKPSQIRSYMKKQKGDFVHSGEMIAKRLVDSQNGKMPMFVQTGTTGSITDIDLKKGTVTIQYNKDPYRRHANLPGEVTEVVEKHSATIRFNGTQFEGVIGFGGESGAPLHWMRNVSDFTAGKINVWNRKLEKDMLSTGGKSGIAGLIAPSIDFDDINSFLHQPIGVGLTGNEHILYPIVITEGFGDFSMPEALSKLLEKSTDKHCYINGMTQIRAGVIRPRVVIV